MKTNENIPTTTLASMSADHQLKPYTLRNHELAKGATVLCGRVPQTGDTYVMHLAGGGTFYLRWVETHFIIAELGRNRKERKAALKGLGELPLAIAITSPTEQA